MARIIVIAGVATGVGKTSITLGLLDALRRRGLEDFDPALDLAGVIVNRVGGEAHGRTVLDAIADTCRATPLGAVARDETLTLPERHLGLVTAAEGVLDAEKLRRLGDAVDRSVDLNRLLSLAREVPPRSEEHTSELQSHSE